jgi:hypothetical protein
LVYSNVFQGIENKKQQKHAKEISSTAGLVAGVGFFKAHLATFVVLTPEL